MLVNGDGKVFVGKRIDNKEGDAWQMPQGGMDEGEDVLAAGLRELGEETGVTEANATLLARGKEELLLRFARRAGRQIMGRQIPRPAPVLAADALHRQR